LVELHHRIMDRVRRELEAFEERVVQRGVDERTARSIARAVAGQEFARLHGIVREELDEFRAEVEEELNKRGVDAETIKRIVGEVQNKLLSELDKRFMHVLDAINEQSSSIRDVLDLVNEILKAEVAFEEELAKLRNEVRRLLNEEYLEELLYRTLVRRGVLKRKRRKWGWVAVGLGILIAIVTGFLINPILTAVVLFIVFVVLMRW